MMRGDDRILPYTKWIAAIIIPFLVVASFLLYVLPTRTDELFSWTIEPPLTAMFLGSAYLGGIWFFAQVLRQRAWHRVRYGFPAVVMFSTLAGVATFLHWDKFHFGHISFITWVVLYVTTPFLTLAVLVVNGRADEGKPEDREARIPLPLRVALAGVGLTALIAGLVLFVDPTLLVNTWAWQLTPLTARIIGAILTLPGMVNLWMLFDSRWSAFKPITQASLFSLVFIVAALAIGSGQLDWGRPSTPVLVVGLGLSLLVYAGIYAYCERLARKAQN